MLTTIFHHNKELKIDLSKPLDISIPLTNTDENPIAWYQNKPEIEPVTMGDWIGKCRKENHLRISIIFSSTRTHTERIPNVWVILPVIFTASTKA